MLPIVAPAVNVKLPEVCENIEDVTPARQEMRYWYS
jgi:hypothetical protein